MVKTPLTVEEMARGSKATEKEVALQYGYQYEMTVIKAFAEVENSLAETDARLRYRRLELNIELQWQASVAPTGRLTSRYVSILLEM